MKKPLFAVCIGLMIGTAVFADVTEKTTVKVNFQKFGTLTQNTTSCYRGLYKSDDSRTEFDSSGLMGRVVGAFFPKGRSGTIHNLPEKNVCAIDYGKKTYTITPIEKISIDGGGGGSDNAGQADDDDSGEEDSLYRVTRNELRVVDTGNTKKINSFDTREFQVIWLYETEHQGSKVIKTDSTFIDLWCCEDMTVFEKADAEKTEFNRELAALMGFDYQNADYRKIMGMDWLKIMRSADVTPDAEAQEPDFSQFSVIKGYPVVIDGHMFSKTFDPNKQAEEVAEEEESSSIPTSVGGLAGGLASRLKKKVEKKEPENKGGYTESLAYYIETEDISFDPVADDVFSAPKGFKEKKD